MARKRRIPPSRRRYEEAHPTVSARLSRGLYNRLKTLQSESGKSLADIIKEALGAQKPSAKNSYRNGFDKGWREAETRYRVDYRCYNCSEPLTVTDDNERRAVSQYMRDHRWVHTTC